VAAVLGEFGIKVEQLDMEYEENHDASLEEIAKGAAQKLAIELNKAVVVEDTGLFFTAYPNFPGALPKFVYESLGYKGIFKLLEGEDREAYFKTVAAFCAPEGEPVLFTATMRGQVTEEVHNEEADVMPYDKIFIPEGESVTISDMTMEKKNSFSQRGQVFRQLGEWFQSNNRLRG